MLLLPNTTVGFQPYETLYNQILKQQVTKKRRHNIRYHAINYKALKTSQSFQSLIRYIGLMDPKALNSPNEQKAFWLNVYNISVLKLIAESYPIKSIDDIKQSKKDLNNIPIITIQKVTYTLAMIEKVLKYQWKDNRLLFGCVKGQISAPNLPLKCFSAKTLDQQLHTQINAFLDNKQKGMKLYSDTKLIYVSSYFKTIFKDANRDQKITGFLKTHKKIDIAGYQIRYLPFKNTLND